METPTRIGVYTDPQFYLKENAYKSGRNPMFVMMDVVRTIYRQAYEAGVRAMLMPGDFVHFPEAGNAVTNLLIGLAKELEQVYPGMKTYYILGNHDYEAGGNLETRITAKTVLQAVREACPESWFELQDETLTIAEGVDLSGITYYRHEDQFFQALERRADEVKDYPAFQVLMIHQDEVNQPPRGRSLIDPEDDRFSVWPIVYSGHIHKRMEYRNGTFIFPGIPAPMHEGDESKGQAKGWYMLTIDGDDFESEFMPIVEVDAGYTVPRFRYYFTGDEIRPEDEGHYIYTRDRVLDVEEAEVVDDTTTEGRTDFTTTFLEGLKQFNPKENGPEVLAEMQAVIAKIPNLEMTEAVTLKFLSLWGEGFRSWVDRFELDLVRDLLTYIQAPVGSGKSSLFEIIAWILYGVTTKEGGAVGDVVTRPALQEKAKDWKGTAGGLLLELDGRVFEIVRSVKYTGKDNYGFALKSGLYVFEHDEVGELSMMEADDFGVTDNEYGTTTAKTKVVGDYFLKGCTYTRFMNTVYFTSDAAKLITGKESEVRAILEPMFELGWVDDAKEQAKVDQATYQTEATKYRGQFDVYTGNVTRETTRYEDAKEQERKDAAQAVEDLEAVREKLSNNRASLNRANDRLPGEKKAVEDARKALQGIKGANPYAATVEAARTAYGAEQDKVATARQALSDLAPEMPDEKEQAAERLVDQYRKEYSKAKAEQEAETIRADRAEADKLAAEKAQADPDALVCSHCNQAYPEGHDHVKALERAVEEATGRMQEHHDKAATATADMQEAERAGKEAKQTYEDLKEARETRNTEARAKLDKAVDKAREGEAKAKKKYDTAKADFDKYEEAQAPDVADAEQTLQAAEEKVDGTNGFIGKLTEAIATQEKQETELANRKPADLSIYTAAIEQAKADRDQAKTKAEEYEAKVAIYDLLVKKVFVATGLKRRLMAAKLDRINELAKKYVSASGTLIRYDMDDNGKWTCNVNLNGELAPAQTLSTGQATLANLMLVHCLADLQREKLDVNLMALDEPFANMDPNYAVQMKRILDVGIGEGITKFVITHVRPLDMTNAVKIEISGSNVEPSRMLHV